jgi:hypothetical protein
MIKIDSIVIYSSIGRGPSYIYRVGRLPRKEILLQPNVQGLLNLAQNWGGGGTSQNGAPGV